MSSSTPLMSRTAFWAALIGIAVVVGLLCCKVRRTSFFSEQVELPVYDLMVRASGVPQQGHPEVLFVAIEVADGWPLSDDDLAETLDAILSGGATVVGLDLIRDKKKPACTCEPGPDGKRGTCCLVADPDAVKLEEVGVESQIIWMKSTNEESGTFPAPPFIMDLPEGRQWNQTAIPQFPGDPPNKVIRRGYVSDGSMLSMAGQVARLHVFIKGKLKGDPDVSLAAVTDRLSELGSVSPSAGGYWIVDEQGELAQEDSYLFKAGQGPSGAVETITRKDLIEAWRGVDEVWEAFLPKLEGKLVILGTNSALIAQDEKRVATDEELRGAKLQALAAAQLLRELEGETPRRVLSDLSEDLMVVLGALLAILIFALKGGRVRWAVFSILPLATFGLGVMLLKGQESTWIPMASVMTSEVAMGLSGLGFLWLVRSRERRFYFSALEKQLGKEVAAAVLGRLSQLESGMDKPPEEFEGTILFGDLSGFSKACQRYSSEGRIEEFFGWLNRFLKPAVELTGSSGGFVKQFAGDGIFVVFGFPPGSEANHAEQAVDCARRISGIVQQLNRELTGDLPPYYVRFGIYTGPLFATAVGSEEQFDFSFMGTTTNKASRLEGLDRDKFKPEECPVRILISNETRTRIPDSESLVPFGEGLTSLKGFEDEPEQVWEVKILCKKPRIPR